MIHLYDLSSEPTPVETKVEKYFKSYGYMLKDGNIRLWNVHFDENGISKIPDRSDPATSVIKLSEKHYLVSYASGTLPILHVDVETNLFD